MTVFVSFTRIITVSLFIWTSVTKFAEYMDQYMGINQIDVVNGYDFISKIEGYIIYEHATFHRYTRFYPIVYLLPKLLLWF